MNVTVLCNRAFRSKATPEEFSEALIDIVGTALGSEEVATISFQNASSRQVRLNALVIISNPLRQIHFSRRKIVQEAIKRELISGFHITVDVWIEDPRSSYDVKLESHGSMARASAAVSAMIMKRRQSPGGRLWSAHGRLRLFGATTIARSQFSREPFPEVAPDDVIPGSTERRHQ